MGRHKFPPQAKAHSSMLQLCILWTLLQAPNSISALNDEGHALQEFRSRLNDTSGALSSWDSDSHSTPCRWTGVACSKDLHVVSISPRNLSGKQLEGNLTLDATRLILLQALNLSSNAFHGSIPSVLGSSASLRILDLSNNAFSGEIPKELLRLLSLSFLNLSNNYLEGSLPHGVVFDSFNATSFEGNHKLCGYPTTRPCESNIRSLLETSPEAGTPGGDGEKNLSVGEVVAICVSAFAASKVFLFLIWFYRWRKTRSNCEVRLSGGRMIMFQQTGHVTPLAMAVLRKALKLTPQDIIGCGGHGTVYKLVMDDMSTFAVKKLTKRGGDRDQGFERELQAMADVKHRNLMALRGFYSAPQISLLVYDFMPNGDLDSVLHDYAKRNEDPIDWELRLKIMLGVARGLTYLHYDCIPHIIHRDIKCSNILLDENMEARVADFGLAKFINPQETHVTTIAAGTLGYLPPEYLETGQITEKGDVYSFGIVLLELLTGKRPKDESFRDHDFCIVQWANALLAEKHPEDVFDENILGAAPDEDLLTALSIAMSCTNGVPKARPSMQHIVKTLQKLCREDDDAIYSPRHFSTDRSSSSLGNPIEISVRTSVKTGMLYPCDVV